MNWNFAPHTDLLDNVGFKDNDIEKFGQDPAKSIVREAIQNSCDALDKENGMTQVKVVIRKGTVDKSLLPNFPNIERHIIACEDPDNDSAENEEVRRHCAAFEKDMYTYLEISDYNTTGMGRTPFESLTQGIFKTSKASSGSQGSKGVGKAAYYASSYLRTMLITTRNEEGVRFRGAAKIANHPDPDNVGCRLNYKGFFGGLGLQNEDDIPPLFRRKEKGTSIFIVGLWDMPNLEKEIIREVLRNYWFAVLKEQLVVIVNDTELNSTNVKTMIEEYFSDYKDYKTGEKQNPRPYIETVLNGKEYLKDILNIGECSLWLHNHEAYNLGAAARFRQTKMLIYKEKDLDIGFAGVFLCDNPEGNQFLKQIENDEHDIWSEKINKTYKDQAKETLTEIKEFIRESYKDYAGIANKPSFNVDMIDDLFNFSGSNTSGKKKRTRVIPPRDPGGPNRDRIVGFAKFRSFTEEGKFYYSLELRCIRAKRGQQFKISIGTDSSQDTVSILGSSTGSFRGNILTLDVVAGTTIVDRIELNSPFLVAPTLVSI